MTAQARKPRCKSRCTPGSIRSPASGCSCRSPGPIRRKRSGFAGRLVAQLDDQRGFRTSATFGKALEAWLRTHAAEHATLDGYSGYVRRTIEPALGDVPINKITPRVLEEFYAELRRCRLRCRGGVPAVDHRKSGPHECRVVRHRRRPGRPGLEPHDCEKSACTVVECRPHPCVPMAMSSILQIHWIVSAALTAAVRRE